MRPIIILIFIISNYLLCGQSITIDKIEIYYVPYEVMQKEPYTKDELNLRPAVDSIKSKTDIARIIDKIGKISADTNFVNECDPMLRASIRFYSSNRLLFRAYIASGKTFYIDNRIYKNDFGLFKLIFDSITIDDRFRKAMEEGTAMEMLKIW